MSFGYTIGDRLFFFHCAIEQYYFFLVKIRARNFFSKKFQAPPPPEYQMDRALQAVKSTHERLYEHTIFYIHGMNNYPVKWNIPDDIKRILHTNDGFNIKMDNGICRTMYVEHDFNFRCPNVLSPASTGPACSLIQWNHVFHGSNFRSKTTFSLPIGEIASVNNTWRKHWLFPYMALPSTCYDSTVLVNLTFKLFTPIGHDRKF